MTDKTIKAISIVLTIIIMGLVVAWFINLGVNAVVDGQKKVDLYQQYIYNN